MAYIHPKEFKQTRDRGVLWVSQWLIGRIGSGLLPGVRHTQEMMNLTY